jgi:hypothetical protein
MGLALLCLLPAVVHRMLRARGTVTATWRRPDLPPSNPPAAYGSSSPGGS